MWDLKAKIKSMTAYQIVSDLLRMREEMWNINTQDNG